MKVFQQIIKEIALELGIDFSLLSDDFIIELKKDNIKKYIYAYKFPLNNQSISLIIDDKFAFYSILKKENLPVISLQTIYEDYKKEDIEKYLEKNKEVILKPNNGTCGKNVFKINDINTLIEKIDFLLSKNSPVLISPFYNIKHEYRLIVLNDEVRLIYGKKRPIIVGDGKSTILELLKKFNKVYYSKNNNLEKLSFDFNKVLEKGKKFEVNFKFNLSGGSTIFYVDNKDLMIKLQELALTVSKKLNIKFASIDIVETEDNELLILEANSGIMMDGFINLASDGYNIAKKIYKDAIISLFK